MNEEIIVTIPFEYSYDCPEGQFRSVVHEVRELEKLTPEGSQRIIRFVFAPDLPRLGNKIILAGKNFMPSMELHSPLRLNLQQWLGKEFLDLPSGQKLNLKSLVGRAADIRTVHIRNAKHSKPYVDIAGIYPPGTLTLTHNVNGSITEEIVV
jgi:hypothetical protein